jgi:serine/threonine protein kinase
MSLQPSTRLGPYEIVSAIGAGGMGEVYRAKDTRLDRLVTIKICPNTYPTSHKHGNGSSARLARFPALIIRTSARSTTSASRMASITW